MFHFIELTNEAGDLRTFFVRGALDSHKLRHLDRAMKRDNLCITNIFTCDTEDFNIAFVTIGTYNTIYRKNWSY